MRSLAKISHLLAVICIDCLLDSSLPFSFPSKPSITVGFNTHSSLTSTFTSSGITLVQRSMCGDVSETSEGWVGHISSWRWLHWEGNFGNHKVLMCVECCFISYGWKAAFHPILHHISQDSLHVFNHKLVFWGRYLFYNSQEVAWSYREFHAPHSQLPPGIAHVTTAHCPNQETDVNIHFCWLRYRLYSDSTSFDMQ